MLGSGIDLPKTVDEEEITIRDEAVKRNLAATNQSK
jgi:hypothetical protein